MTFSTQFKAFGDKLIIFLLVAGIISNSLGVILITHHSNEQTALVKSTLAEQAKATRSNVDIHANQTAETFRILSEQIAHDKEQEEKLLPIFLDTFEEVRVITNDTNKLVKKELDGRPTTTEQLDRIEDLLIQIEQNQQNQTR
jgi:cell division protein FtsL